MQIKIKSPSRGIWYSIGLQFLVGLTPLILLPIVLRSLGPEAYGSYMHASVLSGLLTGIFVTGFSNYHGREYVRAMSEINVANQTSPMVRIFLFQVIGAAVAAVINITVGALIGSGIQQTIYFIAAFGTLLSCFNVDWLFYARGDIRQLFWRTFVVRIGFVTLAALLLRSSEDLLLYAVLAQAALVASNLISFIYAIRQEALIWMLPKKNDFRDARFFFASNLIGSVQQYGDQLIIGLILSKSDLSYLSIFRQILGAANGIVGAVCRVLMPHSVRATHDMLRFTKHIKKVSIYFIIGVACIGVILGILGPPIMQWLAGSRFSFSSLIFLLCAMCFSVTAVSVFIDTQISIPTGNEAITTRSNFIVATLVILGLAMIAIFPNLGYSAALGVLFIAELSGVTCMILYHKKIRTLMD